jgi:cell division protein ZapA
MPFIEVSINGRNYRMACERGQEEHLHRLAQDFDRRIAGVKREFGDIGDARLSVMAALLLADERFEAERRAQELQAALDEAKGLGAAATNRVQATEAAVIAALNAASERIEQVTRGLNQGLSEGVPMG